jgi:hypothetical protein
MTLRRPAEAFSMYLVAGVDLRQAVEMHSAAAAPNDHCCAVFGHGYAPHFSISQLHLHSFPARFEAGRIASHCRQYIVALACEEACRQNEYSVDLMHKGEHLSAVRWIQQGSLEMRMVVNLKPQMRLRTFVKPDSPDTILPGARK